MLHEYEAKLSKVSSDEEAISFSVCTAIVWAESEAEARQHIEEDEPDWHIGRIEATGNEEAE